MAWAVVWGCLTAAGCGDVSRDAPGPLVVVDTASSGRVTVVNLGDPVWGEDEGLALREVFRIGALDSDGPDMFGDILDVEFGSDGELYVLDGQAQEVRVFSSQGTYLRTLGGPGQGPGELNRPVGMAVDAGGELWVMNWRNARYTAFAPATGEVSREVRRVASFTSIPWPGLFDADLRLVDMGLGRAGEPVLLRLDTAFAPVDTMPIPQPDQDYVIVFRQNGAMRMSTLDPFAPRPVWAPRPRGGIVVGEDAEYRFHRIEFGGDTTMTFELRREPVRVTAEERDSSIAAFDDMIAEAGGATPDRRPSVPSVKPAHGVIFVDDADRTWVRGYDQADAKWDVFDSDGRFLGPVSITDWPGFVRPAVRGARIAVATDIGGVPTVVVSELVGGTL